MISRQFERAEDDEDEEPDPSAARGEVRGEVRGEDREGGEREGGGGCGRVRISECKRLSKRITVDDAKVAVG